MVSRGQLLPARALQLGPGNSGLFEELIFGEMGRLEHVEPFTVQRREVGCEKGLECVVMWSRRKHYRD